MVAPRPCYVSHIFLLPFNITFPGVGTGAAAQSSSKALFHTSPYFSGSQL
jgi:hypothetical protein